MNTSVDWPDSPVISAQCLQQHLQNENVRVLDASMHLPGSERNAREEFAEAHIPSAIFFDIDEHSRISDLPHMLPKATQFADAAGSMGIQSEDKIVVYDAIGLFSAARVWWMFKHFGAAHVYVLDGGLPAWKRCGFGTTKDITQAAPRQFIVRNSEQTRASQVVDADAVLQASNQSSAIILDARAAKRFTGEAKEPRKGLRSGHIPGSVSCPYTLLLNDDSTVKSTDEIRSVLDELIVPDSGSEARTEIITSCGSGVTAAVLCLALEYAGYENKVALYDGSWTEWGAHDELPIATL